MEEETKRAEKCEAFFFYHPSFLLLTEHENGVDFLLTPEPGMMMMGNLSMIWEKQQFYYLLFFFGSRVTPSNAELNKQSFRVQVRSIL